jgi:hypothetical protein
MAPNKWLGLSRSLSFLSARVDNSKLGNGRQHDLNIVSGDHVLGADAGSLTHHATGRDRNSPMLIAGLIVLVVAIGLVTTAVLQRKRGMSLAGSEELTVSDVLAQITAAAAALGPGNFRKHVAVSGQLVPSPAG